MRSGATICRMVLASSRHYATDPMHGSKMLLLTAFATLAQAASTSCTVMVDDGISVMLSARAPASDSSLRVEEGWLHVAEASLDPCHGATDEASRAGASRAGGALRAGASRMWGPSVAAAHHGSDDGGALGHAHVLPVHDGALTRMGELRPPPGRYCALRLAVSPATEAAEGFVEAMRRWTVRAEGEYGEARLSARGYGARELLVPLVDQNGSEAELRLDATAETHTVMLEIDLGRALPEQTGGHDAEDLGADLLAQLQTALTARIER